jgi:pimeloyl-ACP methyl ester carboxylesterase
VSVKRATRRPPGVNNSAGRSSFAATWSRCQAWPTLFHGSRNWSAGLASFDKPALVISSPAEDQMMPPEHGRRLADLLPEVQLVEIEDCYTVHDSDTNAPAPC